MHFEHDIINKKTKKHGNMAYFTQIYNALTIH